MPLERPKISTITDTSGTTYDLSAKYDTDGNEIKTTYAKIADIPPGATASSTTPKMDGTAAVGSETAFARGDHVHPSDTSREATSNKVTSVTYLSTDTQYPSAKAVYDMVKLGRVLHNGHITYGEVIVQNSIIGMSYGITNSRYITITPGTSVDLSYPLLYWTGESYDSGTKGVSGNTDSFYAIENVRIQNNQSCTVGGMIYMVGTLSGNVFTADTTTMFTNTPPNNEDGKVYIPIGIAKSNSGSGCTLDFKPYGQIFEYRNGAFRPFVSGLDVFNDAISELDEKLLGMISDTVWSLSDMQNTPRALSDGEYIIGEISSGEWALIQITDDLIAGYDLIAQPMWEAVTVSGSLYYIINQLALKENLSNKVTSLSASSTHTQYPSAKAVYDFATGDGKRGLIEHVGKAFGDLNKHGYYASKIIHIENSNRYSETPIVFQMSVDRYSFANLVLKFDVASSSPYDLSIDEFYCYGESLPSYYAKCSSNTCDIYMISFGSNAVSYTISDAYTDYTGMAGITITYPNESTQYNGSYLKNTLGCTEATKIELRKIILTNNLVTSLSSSSTNSQAPSAKAVYDAVKNTVSGSGTSGYLAKFNDTRGVTNGPQLGSSTTTYLRNDGSWATPPGTPVLRFNSSTETLYVTTS